MWLTPVEIVESEEDLGCLPPERAFIAAEPIERVVRQIGEAQKALGEVEAGVGGRFGGLRIDPRQELCCIRGWRRCRFVAGTDGISRPEQGVDHRLARPAVACAIP